MNLQKTCLTVISSFGLAAGLIACGEDSVSDFFGGKEGMDIYSTVSELPKCTSDNKGVQVFVVEEGLSRVCADEKWFPIVGQSSTDTLFVTNSDTVYVSNKDTVYVTGHDTLFVDKDFACTTEPLADETGIKIVCNGDSIGVVLNGRDGVDGVDGRDGVDGQKGADGLNGTPGQDGAPGKDGASSCTIDKTSENVTLICGDKSVVMKLGADGSLIGAEELVLDSEMVAVSLDSVTGASQKGPFLKGSKVTVRELSNGRVLSQTGNGFEGKILDDDGRFKLAAHMLVSQYALFIVEGYYRNEVTGTTTQQYLTLFGITDVSGRNVVNINLLTHLEYERVFYLVTEQKKKVREAKAIAQREILDILHIDNSKFSNSEDLTIAGSSDEDGALLAYSILMQGDRDVGALTELLTTISTDLELDGKWDNGKDTLLKIADWAMAADTSGRLKTIRNNVESWKLSAMVPKFEPYIRNFWRIEYGLGKCGDSVKVGTVAAATRGATVGTKVRFVCSETAEGTRWVTASDIEKDTYGWTAGNDGTLKEGDVSKKQYVYDAAGAKDGLIGWREAESIEKQYGGCREDLYDSIRTDKVYARYYKCDRSTHVWVQITNYLIIDTQYWPDSTDGKVRWGDSVGVVDKLPRICYVWDDNPTYRGWRPGNTTDCNLGLMGCTEGRAGEMRKASNGRYYNCANNKWIEIDDDVYINTYLYRCTPDQEGERIFKEGDLVYGIEKTKTKYACESSAWRATKTGEEQANKACTKALQGLIQGDSITCDAQNWRPTIIYDYKVGEKNWFNPNLKYGDLYDERDGRHYKTIKIGTQVWMAENLNYADSISSPYLRGQTWCYLYDSTNCLKGGRYYSWSAALDIDAKWKTASPFVVDGLIDSPLKGSCPNGWHIPTIDEWKILGGNADYKSQQATGTTAWNNATNVSGFSALPVGYIYLGSSYHDVGQESYFVSQTELSETAAYSWLVKGTGAYMSNYGSKQSPGFPVRCLRDTPATDDD